MSAVAFVERELRASVAAEIVAPQRRRGIRYGLARAALQLEVEAHAMTHGVVGFFGASSMERLPTEVAITETVRRFKAIPAHK